MLQPKDREVYNQQSERSGLRIVTVINEFPGNKDFPLGSVIHLREIQNHHYRVEDCQGERIYGLAFFEQYPHLFQITNYGTPLPTPSRQPIQQGPELIALIEKYKTRSKNIQHIRDNSIMNKEMKERYDGMIEVYSNVLEDLESGSLPGFSEEDLREAIRMARLYYGSVESHTSDEIINQIHKQKNS